MFIFRYVQKVVLMACSVVFAAEAAEWKSPHSLKAERKAPAALLPFPKKVKWMDASAPLPGREEWVLKWEPQLSEMLSVAWEGVLAELPEATSGQKMICRLVLTKQRIAPSAEAEAEAYSLSVTPNEVVVRAAHEAGLFYGLQTLRQLLAGSDKKLPLCEIRDWPAFAVRGFHIDCGRNFQTIESLKRQLDIASRLKVNYFHWHLTDHPAWHIECKKYPQLNDPKFRTRDQNDTYSYDQIRELIAYAKARHITIIPELDMPGHSSFFDRVFGFSMGSEQGRAVLEELLDEFCSEVPAEDCPILHFGADEVKVADPKVFVERISKKIISHGRVPMQWGGPHDLPVGKDSISQRWGEGGEMVDKSLKPETIRCHTLDSTPGYTNLFDPGFLVRRWFFMRPCGVGAGDSLKMGVLICNWPDMRVADKSLIPLHSAQWPGLCAMAERAWEGGEANGDALPADMPAPGTEAAQAFMLFEARMEAMRNTVFKGEHFPYWQERAQKWVLVEPVPEAAREDVRPKVLAGRLAGLKTRPAYGANLYFRTKPNTGCLGIYSDVKPGNCVWAVTEIYAEKEGAAPFMIGFDAPARSSRRYSGVPAAGEWSQCGTRVWLNGQELKNPQVYELAGKNRYVRDTWTHPANENPLSNEEVWWAHEPTMLPLRKGKNTIIIEQPYIGEFQSWGVSLIPLFHSTARSSK